MGETKIEWTEQTWNPVRGCKMVSPGCANCCAMRMAGRLSGKGQPYHGLVQLGSKGKGFRWTGDFREVPELLDVPLRRRKPTTYFVNSMSDLFGERVSDEFIDQVLAVMLLSPRHVFQVLTKRAARMARYLSDPGLYKRVLRAADRFRNDRPELCQVGISDPSKFPARWIWWGVSVESREYADERIPHLLRTPAAVRFLSMEPLLGPVNLTRALGYRQYGCNGQHHGKGTPDCPRELHHHHDDRCKFPIDWVIVGGESGPRARPCEAKWIRSIVAQCKDAGVPAFVKQLGSAYSDEVAGIAGKGLGVSREAAPLVGRRLVDAKGGDLGEWPEDLRVREMPEVRR